MRFTVLEAWLTLTPHRDIIVQPYTGKVVRQALYRLADAARLDYLARLLEEKGQYKPYSTTPLLLDGRPLVKAGPGPPLTLRAGTSYRFRLSIISNDAHPSEILLALPARVELYDAAPATLALSAARLLPEDTVATPVRRGDTVALDFVTPTQLQLPKINKRARRGRYVMTPHPYYLFYSLREMWNRYAEEKITSAPWRANYALLSTYVAIRSTAIQYDKNRTIVGFTGRAAYRVETRSTRLLAALSRLLALASLMGVGKSRGIGLGYVKVAVKQPKAARRRRRRSPSTPPRA